MSAQGSAPRATLDLKVRVWGMGSNNQPFFQNAMAQNISATGACIFGIEPELKVGDVIGVQYETRKARCKVVWVVDAGALKKTQVGVQLVADQDCPWAAARMFSTISRAATTGMSRASTRTTTSTVTMRG